MLCQLCRDQRLYKASLTSKTCDLQPLTAEDSKLRFADAVIDVKRNRLILVCEDHSKEGEAVNTISSVGQTPICLDLGSDVFRAAYMYLELRPAATKRLFAACDKHDSSPRPSKARSLFTDLLCRQASGPACCKLCFKACNHSQLL